MNKNIVFVYSDRKIVMGNEIENKEDFIKWKKRYTHLYKNWAQIPEKIQDGKIYLKDPNLLKTSVNNKIGEPTCVLLNKQFLKKAGYFNESLNQSLDYEAWYRLMPFGNIGFINETLCGFRIHMEQASRKNQRNNLNEDKKYRFYVKSKLYKYLHPSVRQSLDEEFPTNYIKAKRRIINMISKKY
jgi:hypothetical protein